MAPAVTEWGTMDTEIKIPCAKNAELSQLFSFGDSCFASCQEFCLPNIYLFSSLSVHFFLILFRNEQLGDVCCDQ